MALKITNMHAPKAAQQKKFCTSNPVIVYIGHLGGITYKEGVATVAADHPHPLRLDGQCRLGRLLLRDYHHRA